MRFDLRCNFILCPSEVTQIFTQEYDSYQWYKKSFSGTNWEIIPGETSQFLDISQGIDDLYYFNVATTFLAFIGWLTLCISINPNNPGWSFNHFRISIPLS